MEKQNEQGGSFKHFELRVKKTSMRFAANGTLAELGHRICQVDNLRKCLPLTSTVISGGSGCYPLQAGKSNLFFQKKRSTLLKNIQTARNVRPEAWPPSSIGRTSWPASGH